MVEELFTSLQNTASPTEQIPISVALCSIASTLKEADITQEVKERLYSKIFACQQATSETTRHVALFYATHVLPFNDVNGRYSCFLSVVELKQTTKDIAERGLKPYKLSDANMIEDETVDYPNFFELVSFITQQYAMLAQAKGTSANSIPYDSRIYSAMLRFLRKTMEVQISKNQFDITKDCSEYIQLIENAFNATKLLDLHKVAAANLTQVFTIIPQTVHRFTDRLDYLWPFLFKGKLFKKCPHK